MINQEELESLSMEELNNLSYQISNIQNKKLSLRKTQVLDLDFVKEFLESINNFLFKNHPSDVVSFTIVQKGRTDLVDFLISREIIYSGASFEKESLIDVSVDLLEIRKNYKLILDKLDNMNLSRSCNAVDQAIADIVENYFEEACSEGN